MPQGLRGRVALVGAGLVFCSGLTGCLTDEKGKAPPVSKAKNGVVTPAGAKTTYGAGAPVGGTGISNGAPYQPGTFQPIGAGGAPTPGYTGGIGAPGVPGIHGAGAPLPGNQPTIPSVTPTPSNYPPGGGAIPPGYGSSNVPPQPTTARAAAPSPPVPSFADAPRPPAPPGALTPVDSGPPVPLTGPIAPPPYPPGGSR